MDLYTFKCMYNHTYLVEIDQREHDIFVPKLYLKSHKLSENRYSLTILDKLKKEIDPNIDGTENFLKILNTILLICKSYLDNKNQASFAFMGSPKISEIDTKQNFDGSFYDTTRFRIYKNFVLKYFSPKNFKHIEFRSTSFYLVMNKKNQSLNKSIAEKLLNSYLENE